MRWREGTRGRMASRFAALAAAPLNHVVVVSVEVFAALHTGQADFGYGDWLRVASWAALTNLIGGVLFVTALRLAQVGQEAIRKERRRHPDSPRDEGE